MRPLSVIDVDTVFPTIRCRLLFPVREIIEGPIIPPDPRAAGVEIISASPVFLPWGKNRYKIKTLMMIITDEDSYDSNVHC